MAANSDAAPAPDAFRRAAHELLTASWRPELVVEEIPAPQRIAPFAAAIPILATAVIAWMLTSLSADEWKALVALVAVAVGVFVATRPSRRAARVEGGL